MKVARWDYIDRPACLQGTRIEELEKLMDWMDDEGERRMYVLTGLAGTGKTTIAKSAADLANGKHILGASFFCSRASDERSNMQLIFPTIAFQLSHYSTDFRAEILKAITSDPDIGHSLFDNQLEKLLVGPMQSVVVSIGSSFKRKLGFFRSLTDRQIEQLISRPLRVMATSLETLPEFSELYPDAQHVMILPLQSVATSFEGEQEIRETVVNEIALIIHSIKTDLPIDRIHEVIIRPIRKVITLMENYRSEVIADRQKKAETAEKDHAGPDRSLPENRALNLPKKLATFIFDLRAVIALAEERLSDQLRRSIVEPSRQILSSVQEFGKSHILTDFEFNNQVVEPMRKLIASAARQDASRSLSDNDLKERIEEPLRSIVSSLREKLDISPWLSDAEVDDTVLRSLRTIAKAIPAGPSPIPGQLKTRQNVISQLQTIFANVAASQRTRRSLSDEEFDASITEFLRRIKYFVRPVIIVVDALDECKDLETPEKFLLAFAKHIQTVPFLKVFATSRPEFSTRLALQHSSMDCLTDILILHEVDPVRVDADIRLFLRVRLAAIATRRRCDNSKLPDLWPPEELVDKLVEKSSGLFIFAFTICRFLESPGDLREQLEFIANLNTNTEEGRLGIDELYQKVIDAALSNFVDRRLVSQCALVIAAIVLLFDPLSLVDLAGVLDIDPDRIRGILRDLHSVLVVPSNDKAIIHTFHASFHDFLTERTRCSSQIYVHSGRRHMEITMYLLQRMMQGLKRNICQLDGFTLNSEVLDLHDRKEKYIGQPLAYACRYWAEHLSNVSPTEGGKAMLVRMLDKFMETKFLYWVEVLSILGDIRLAEASLVRARRWFSVCSKAGVLNKAMILTSSSGYARLRPQQSSR